MTRAALSRVVDAARASRARTASSASRFNRPATRFEDESNPTADTPEATAASSMFSMMSVNPAAQRLKEASHRTPPTTDQVSDRRNILVNEALHSHAEPLDAQARAYFEPRFQRDFSKVRIHADDRGAVAADAVRARAFTVGSDIVFARGEFNRASPDGRQLLAHELAHTIQQEGGTAAGQLHVSDPALASERSASAGAQAALDGRCVPPLGRTALTIARQQKPGTRNDDQDDQKKDPFAGTQISEIIVSLARGRVGFRWNAGMILGDVKTDLTPGVYPLKADVATKKWIIEKPGVKAGVRFDVDLEGADPWTLSYPATLNLTVSAGSADEPKTFGDVLGDEKLKDPLWLWEGQAEENKIKPVTGIDDFESANYDPDFKSEKGDLSKWLSLSYRDNTIKDVGLDSITQDTPRLWAAKAEALKIMDDYNTLFIEAGFQAIFFIITIAPMVSVEPPGSSSARAGARYIASRQRVFKGGGGAEPPVEQDPPGPGEPVPGPKGTKPLKASGRTTPGNAGDQGASARARVEQEAQAAGRPQLPAQQQQIAAELVKEHPKLNSDVAADAAKGGKSAAGKGGEGADVPLLNGGGREVSVHQSDSPFTADSVGTHLQKEAMQKGTTEIYLQINSTGATREGWLKMLPSLRNAYLELRGVTVKIFGPDGKVWWSGTFGGPR